MIPGTYESFTFAAANGANDWANGKLRTAVANNYYDPNVPASNFLSQETYTYGSLGGRVSQRDTLAGVVGGYQGTFTQTFTWSDLGVPAAVTYPQKAGVGPSRTVTFDYTNGWLSRVHEGSTNYASSISYHANGMVNQVTRPNSTTDTYGKDPNDMPRPASVKVQGPLGLTLWNTGTYTYDGSGNVWKMTNASNVDTFTYDKVSRLREGKILSVAKKQCQSYDAFGNIKGQATVASSQTCTPSSWSVDSATNRFLAPVTYDAAGEQLSWNSGAYVYWWYPTGQMRQFDSSGRVTIHGYSADGERVVTYDSSLTGVTYTLRNLDGKVLRVYREASGVWTWIQDYVYRDGAHLATIDSTGTRHLHLDHLGTVRLITNASGTQVALHTYLPFGQEATSTSQDSERMKFTGHERDLRDTSVTTDDLDYMHARHYNPNLGRFLSPDLLRGNSYQPQSFHLYAYVQNNPMNFADPWGLQALNQYDPADPTMAGLTGYDPNMPGLTSTYIWYWPCLDFQCDPVSFLLQQYAVGDSYWRWGWNAVSVVGSSGGGSGVSRNATSTPTKLCRPASAFSDCLSRCIERERFDLTAVLGTLGLTLAAGTMPKTEAELRAFGIPRESINPYTSQLSRWSGRMGWRGLREAGRSAAGRVLGAAATSLTVLEGFYDIGAIGRCLVVCSSNRNAY